MQVRVLDWLYAVDPWLSYLCTIVLLIGVVEFARWVGTSRRRRGHTATSEITTLETAALGLLALMIGFTFSIALNRFDARKALLLEEANAIGTTALRARLLPAPHAGEVNRLLRDYLQVRIDLIGQSPTRAILNSAVDRANGLQEQLWQHAVAVSTADPHSINAGLFVQSLNETIDLQEKRLIAADNHVPEAVFVLLYTIAIVAAGFTGYSAGLIGRSGRIPNVLAVMLIATVIGLVGDIDRPLGGFVTVSPKAMLDLMANFPAAPDSSQSPRGRD